MWSSVFKITVFITRFITDFDQFLETTPAAKAKKMNITIILTFQFVSGDLIGWNRARNTVYKSRMNGESNRKSNLNPLMNQYNTFRRIKNGENNLYEQIQKYTTKNQRQNPSRQNRRKFRFRQFHEKTKKK